MRRFFFVVMGIAALYAASTGVVAWLLLQSKQERRAQEEKIVSLGAQLAPALEAMSTFGDALKVACKGRLEVGGPRSVVLYSLPLPSEARPGLDGKRVDGQFAGWVGTYAGIEPADPLAAPTDFSVLLTRASEFYEWPRRFEQRELFRADTQSLRYLAVALFSDLSPAALPFLGKEGSFDPGRAEYRVKVVTFPEGKPVCEGVGKGRMIEKVVGHGKARDSFDAQRAARSDLERKLIERWVEATLGSPLEDLCAAGGEKLCASAALMTDGPDW